MGATQNPPEGFFDLLQAVFLRAGWYLERSEGFEPFLVAVKNGEEKSVTFAGYEGPAGVDAGIEEAARIPPGYERAALVGFLPQGRSDEDPRPAVVVLLHEATFPKSHMFVLRFKRRKRGRGYEPEGTQCECLTTRYDPLLKGSRLKRSRHSTT